MGYNALFIGRFQPFHNGHMKVIRRFIKKYDVFYIGIGSSQYHHTLENPFTFEERKEMISKTLDDKGYKNYSILSLPDIHNPPFWVAHIKRIVPNFSDVITNNENTNILFKDKGFKTIQTEIYNREQYSGREIRLRMLEDKPWDTLVPELVYKYLQELHAPDRLKSTK